MSVPIGDTLTCPACNQLITPDTDVVACTECGRSQHRHCWESLTQCATPQCPGLPLQRTPTAEITLPPEPPVVTSFPPTPPPAAYTGPVAMALPPQTANLPDLYMDGDRTLIIRAGSTLPPICLATGATEDLLPRKKTETWAPSWVYIIAVFSLLIGAIVYACVKKTGQINFSFTKPYATKRLLLMVGNWLLFVGLFIAMFIGFAYDESTIWGFSLLIASIFVPVVAYYLFLHLYTVTKIDNGYLWLKFRKPEIANAIYAAATKR